MYSRVVLAVLLFVGPCTVSEEKVVPLPPSPHRTREAVWVYSDVVTSPDERRRLVDGAKQRSFDTLYLSVYRPEENARGHRMYDEAMLADLIGQAHDAGLEVWAAYGNPDWVDLGSAPGSFPHDRIMEIAAFNRTHPATPFDGVILNVEPPEPVDMEALVSFYRGAAELLSSLEMQAAVAVRFFWKQSVAGAEGAPRAAYKAILDLPLNHMVVMGYRNYAGEPCEDNGLICLNEDHIRYADRAKRNARVLIGLRTTSVDADAGSPIETFYGYPISYVTAEKKKAAEFFSRFRGFGGFATHQFDDASPSPSPPTTTTDAVVITIAPKPGPAR